MDYYVYLTNSKRFIRKMKLLIYIQNKWQNESYTQDYIQKGKLSLRPM
ncbi:hypothetical protein HYE00_00890 [Mycoplasmopsis bovis]|nr:hypothetical protein [Mycoplasmopsis bovis]QQH28616.1 hypothetical protein HYE00_00890 [Mycoplasmopsis bovis]